MKNEIKKNKGMLWGSVVIIITIVVLAMVYFVNNSDKENIGENKNSNNSIVLNESDWIRGDVNAKVVIVEYADFECPACAAYHGLVKEMGEKFKDESVAFVFRHFPLSQIHRNALLSAQATEAAGVQGKFWEMHDIIFETQTDWSEKNNAKEIFTAYADTLGLNKEQFLSDLDSKVIKEKIAENYKGGAKLGVNGTPTFFVNGNKIQNPRSAEEFEALITKELSL